MLVGRRVARLCLIPLLLVMLCITLERTPLLAEILPLSVGPNRVQAKAWLFHIAPQAFFLQVVYSCNSCITSAIFSLRR